MFGNLAAILVEERNMNDEFFDISRLVQVMKKSENNSDKKWNSFFGDLK